MHSPYVVDQICIVAFLLQDYMSALEPCIELTAINQSESVASMDASVSRSQSSDLQTSLASRIYSYGELHPQYDKRGSERALVRAIGYHAIYGCSITESQPSVIIYAILLLQSRKL